MASTRQLAAIMFTDMAGYISLMGIDEEKAFNHLKLSRNIQKPLIHNYNGQWIKELGHSVLASFSTVTDAVTCAGAIQQSCRETAEFKLRIGIHIGEIVFEDNDIFGDGVNIASRIMPLAAPGEICITESVYKNISNKKGIKSRFLGEEALKNVKDPVRIYEVRVDPSVIAEHAGETNQFSQQNNLSPKTTNPHEKSIAVLPFVNMSNDPDQEYFSDGMTEEIINSLSHVAGLRVAGRTSSFHFKGKNMDLRKIGQLLNIHTILEGSVRKQGNKVRITAQLINLDDGFHIWSEKYDREMDDIFAIQDEIALAITEKLKITLLEKDKAVIYSNPTESKEAYDLYLKGKFYYNKRGEGLQKALGYFQKALEKDPGYALAYAGMAEAYYLLAFWGVMLPHDAMPKAKHYAEKAIQCQPSLPEAYASLAFIRTFYDWDWTEAKKQFQFVFAMNPNYAPAHYWYSYYLSFVERKSEEAIREAKNAAVHLEPLSPLSHHVVSIMYVMAGRFKEGIEASKMAIELDPDSFPAYRGLGLNLAGLNRYEEAIEALKMAVILSRQQPLPMVELSWIYSLSGQDAALQIIADELIRRSQNEYISGTFMCCVAYYSKKYDLAIRYIKQAFEQRDSLLVGIQSYPISAFFRTDPRFLPFLEKMNFPQ